MSIMGKMAVVRSAEMKVVGRVNVRHDVLGECLEEVAGGVPLVEGSWRAREAWSAGGTRWVALTDEAGSLAVVAADREWPAEPEVVMSAGRVDTIAPGGDGEALVMTASGARMIDLEDGRWRERGVLVEPPRVRVDREAMATLTATAPGVTLTTADLRGGLNEADRKALAQSVVPVVNRLIATAQGEGATVAGVAVGWRLTDRSGNTLATGVPVVAGGLTHKIEMVSSIGAGGSVGPFEVELTASRPVVEVDASGGLPGGWSGKMGELIVACGTEPAITLGDSALAWRIEGAASGSPMLRLTVTVEERDAGTALEPLSECGRVAVGLTEKRRVAVRPAAKSGKSREATPADRLSTYGFRARLSKRQGDTMVWAGIIPARPRVSLPEALTVEHSRADGAAWAAVAVVTMADGTHDLLRSSGTECAPLRMSPLAVWPDSRATAIEMWVAVTGGAETEVHHWRSALLTADGANGMAWGEWLEAGAASTWPTALPAADVAEPVEELGLVAVAPADRIGTVMSTASCGSERIEVLAGAARRMSTWGFGSGHLYGLSRDGVSGIAVSGVNRRLTVTRLTRDMLAGGNEAVAELTGGVAMIAAGGTEVVLVSGTGRQTLMRRPAGDLVALGWEPVRGELLVSRADGVVTVIELCHGNRRYERRDQPALRSALSDGRHLYVSDGATGLSDWATARVDRPTEVEVTWEVSWEMSWEARSGRRIDGMVFDVTAESFDGEMEVSVGSLRREPVACLRVRGEVRSPMGMRIFAGRRDRIGATIKGLCRGLNINI